MSRGRILGLCGMVFGILGVVAAWVCLQLIGQVSSPDHQWLIICVCMLVTYLCGVAAASLFQHYTPTLFENVFDGRNFRGITSPRQFMYGAAFGSLGSFLGYALGVLITYAVVPVGPTMTLLMVLSSVLGFVTYWYATTERLPRGVESTVEVWLFHDVDQPNMRAYTDQFFQWAAQEGSPHLEYGTDQLSSVNARSAEYGITEAPTVTVRKLYYRNGDPYTPVAVIASKITGTFSGKQISDEVRRLQAERKAIC